MARVQLVNVDGNYRSYRVHHHSNCYLAAVAGSQPRRLGTLDADGRFTEIEICPPELARAIFGSIQRHEARKPVSLMQWVGFIVWAVIGYSAVSALLALMA